MQRFVCVLVGVLMLSCAVGCDYSEPQAEGAPSEYPYRITTTVGMIGDIAREVAGDKASVHNIIGTGLDPHAYEAKRGDTQRLDDAHVVFYNGLFLEGKMATTLESMRERGKRVYAVGELIREQGDYEILTHEQEADPHVWMDVQGWIRATNVVTEKLSEYDPTHADYYRANADAYIEQLQKLDTYARETIASIPESQRILITAHDAFSYLGRAYGLEVRGVQGISTESEAGVLDRERLATLIVDRQVPMVFLETSVNRKSVDALIESATDLARSRGLTEFEVGLGGDLFSDAMGVPGTYEGTYIGMIDHNVTTIARALGGTAPERGMQGKLSASE